MTLREEIAEIKVNIHFKENGVPSLRGGTLTKESIDQIILAVKARVPRKITGAEGLAVEINNSIIDEIEGELK